VASGRDCASLKFAVLYLSLSRGTGRRFLVARLPQAKRYAQCRGTDSVLRTLAHLLAANSTATPKQAKEPIISTHDKVMTNRSIIFNMSDLQTEFTKDL
jgi:hypothetical protein